MERQNSQNNNSGRRHSPAQTVKPLRIRSAEMINSALLLSRILLFQLDLENWKSSEEKKKKKNWTTENIRLKPTFVQLDIDIIKICRRWKFTHRAPSEESD